MTLEEARRAFDAELATSEGRARWERLKAMREEDIDFSDIPELTDEQLAGAYRPGRGGVRPGSGRKATGNVSVSIRIPAAWAEGFRAEARKTCRPLSDVMRAHLRQPAGSR
jgi:hypothetical protein